MTLNRNTDIADVVKHGVVRVLSHTHHAASLCEVSLPNNRRADVMSIGPKGEIYIIEVKSSIADFRGDTKWWEYKDFCDYFYFAVMPDFPTDILPDTEGLILADGFGGQVTRPAIHDPVAAARRKLLLIRFARLASWRLSGQELDHD